MIGVSLEKLVLVLVLVALVVGPTRLPAYAERIGAWARGLRAFVDAARLRAETELGMPVRVDGWEREVRRYDPRRIVRDALAAPDAPRDRGADAAQGDGPDATATPRSGSEAEATLLASAASAAPAMPAAGQALRWVVVGGSSGHPRRVRMAVPAAQAAVAAASELDAIPPLESGAAAATEPAAHVASASATAAVATPTGATDAEHHRARDAESAIDRPAVPASSPAAPAPTGTVEP